jgi:hypothetical protein
VESLHESLGSFSDDDDDDDINGSSAGEASFRASKVLQKAALAAGATNVWLSTRGGGGLLKTESGSDYDVIPTLLEECIALVCDANLTHRDTGRLYYDELAFYNGDTAPFYVVTVNPYIFQSMLLEVHHRVEVPCGLYFCCQGGDGAHTGVSHGDFVDIEFAYFLVAVIFVGFFVISCLPGDEDGW